MFSRSIRYSVLSSRSKSGGRLRTKLVPCQTIPLWQLVPQRYHTTRNDLPKRRVSHFSNFFSNNNPSSSPPPPFLSIISSSSSSSSRHRHLSTATINEPPLSSSPSRTIPFLLADIGEGIAEVELLQWFISPGDHVNQFDRVCEVQSDKATVEITSRYDGVVESLSGSAGDMINVGSPLMYVRVEGGEGDDDENGDERAVTTMSNEDEEGGRLRIPVAAAEFAIEDGKGVEGGGGEGKQRVLTSPAVRKMAKENNIDLNSIVGTGPKQRILKGDLLTILNPNTINQKQHPTKGTPTVIAQPSSTAAAEQTPPAPIPIRGYNRLMIKTMTESLTIPHMTYADEIDFTNLHRTRQKINDALRTTTTDNLKLSYLPFAIKAASLSLNHHPTLNATLDLPNNTILPSPRHNIGIAMDTPRGLAVPVLKDVQHLSLLDIAAELKRLQAVAIENNLSSDDVSRATFSLSNIGAMGGTYMSPIVTPPQVAIGALGRVRRLPRFVGEESDEVRSVWIGTVSWGADHRVIDGGTLARFSNKWKEYMEDPCVMMTEMR